MLCDLSNFLFRAIRGALYCMEIIFLLIPLSLLLVAAAIWAFFWATRSGQFDDLDSPALSILDDEQGSE